MTYDVLAIAQVAMLFRRKLSVRIVQRGLAEHRAQAKLAEMQRSTEGTRIDGQETFVIVEHGAYKPGEIWKGAKE